MNPNRDFIWRGIAYHLEIDGGNKIYSRQDGNPMSAADLENVREWYRLLPSGPIATTNPQYTMQGGQQPVFGVLRLAEPSITPTNNNTWLLLGAGLFFLFLIRR